MEEQPHAYEFTTFTDYRSPLSKTRQFTVIICSEISRFYHVVYRL